MNGSECSTPPLAFRNLQQSPPDINEQIRRILFNGDNGQHFQQNTQQMAHSNSFPLSLCSTVACSSNQQTVPRIHHHQQNSHQHYQQSFPAFMPMSNSFSFSPGSQQQQQILAYTPPLWRVSSPPTIPPHLGHSSKYVIHSIYLIHSNMIIHSIFYKLSSIFADHKLLQWLVNWLLNLMNYVVRVHFYQVVEYIIILNILVQVFLDPYIRRFFYIFEHILFLYFGLV